MLREFGKWEKAKDGLGEQGFYKIPSQPDLVIKPNGEIYSKKNNSNLEHKFNLYVDVNFERTTYKLHNFLAEAFVKVPEELLDLERSGLIANHIDGDKYNFALDNLEWTTYSGNIIHAYKTGLRDDNNRVLARNTHTGETVDFYSQAECARFFKVDPANVVYWLKNRKIFNTCRGFFQFKYEEEIWPDISINEEIRAKRSDIFAKSIDETKPSLLLPSIASAERYLDIKKGNLVMHMLRHGSKPYKGYEFHCLYMYLDKIQNEEFVVIDPKKKTTEELAT